MFNKALIKLTFLYLLIMMAISFFFSFSIYRVTSFEFINNIRGQQRVIERFGRFPQPFLENPDFLRERESLLNRGREQIGWGLFYVNTAILFIGGGLSYLLARWTLKPIKETHESQIRFTADASHELRSPLSVMQMENEVALRNSKLTKEEAVKLLESNLEEVKRLRNLSEGLLELARENNESFTKERLNTNEVIELAIKNVQKETGLKKIKISKEVAKDLFFIGNKDGLMQVFTILLDNAIKYSETGKTITVSVEVIGNNLNIYFKDQGVGIRDTDINHIFDRFYRVDASRSKNKVFGYGLGLSIVEKIIKANRGEIKVESKIGKGSTFIVKLPIARS